MEKMIVSLDIDAQIDFTPLGNGLKVEDGHNIVGELNKSATLADKRANSRELHNRNSPWVTDDADESGALFDGHEHLDRKWMMHCEFGTKGAELLDGLPHPLYGYDFMVVKGTEVDSHPYGACYHDAEETKPTGLIAQIKEWGTDYVIAGGLAYDFCVATTVIQLQKAGINVLVNKAACRSVFPESEELATERMLAAGAMIFDNAAAIKEFLGK